MKRRDFLKGILATPVVAGLAKKINHSPIPSEVKISEECENEAAMKPDWGYTTLSPSASPSAMCFCSIDDECLRKGKNE